MIHGVFVEYLFSFNHRAWQIVVTQIEPLCHSLSGMIVLGPSMSRLSATSGKQNGAFARGKRQKEKKTMTISMHQKWIYFSDSEFPTAPALTEEELQKFPSYRRSMIELQSRS